VNSLALILCFLLEGTVRRPSVESISLSSVFHIRKLPITPNSIVHNSSLTGKLIQVDGKKLVRREPEIIKLFGYKNLNSE
jgi:hypothetical protein